MSAVTLRQNSHFAYLTQRPLSPEGIAREFQSYMRKTHRDNNYNFIHGTELSIPMNEEDITRCLPDAFQPLPLEMKVALVQNGYVGYEYFPVTAGSSEWSTLKEECAFNTAQCNRLKRIVYPSQQQGIQFF